MTEIKVSLGERSYPVLIKPGLSSNVRELLIKLAPSPRYYVITDENIAALYRSLFPAGDPMYPCFTVPAGEDSKSVETLRALWSFLLENKIERSHVVVALGGGVVGDLAGFGAASILRGVRLIQIPTTLLAQVDAAIGGKTGINHPLGKNLIGAFHQPVAVLIDTDFLKTLPEREYRSGMYEVIKYALIQENGLYRLLVDSAGKPGDIASIVEACVRCKADIVSRDEREGDQRMILNFGHTLGHAIEAAGGFRRLTHGQSVGWGMLFAADLAAAEDICDQATRRSIQQLVHLNGALPPVQSTAASLVDLMQHDKKLRDGRFTFVLPKRVGQVEIRRGIPLEVVRRRLEAFLS
ncbi:MAG TPA: 3-dehydroquinate synthase [Acidobacteriota bacterium]|jgi:3-dehydroquinate synthase